MSRIIERIKMIARRRQFPSKIIRQYYPDVLEQREDFLELARDS